MKIALLADTHFGVRSDSNAFLNNMRKFYDNVFIPYCVSNHVKKIIHLGDVFDNRKKIDMNTAAQAREFFFEPIADNHIQIDIIAGNHDLYFRESSDVTALKEILGLYKNIDFFTNMHVEGPFRYVPWINNENRAEVMSLLEAATEPVLLGHFDIIGYKMYRNQIAKHGLDPKIFKSFKHVYSGHYHHRHTIDNITYLGSPSQHIWADAGDVRGFHVFDDETLEIEFIENPYRMFETITYPTSEMIKREDVEGKYIRIEFGTLEKQSMFDEFHKMIEAYNPTSLALIQKTEEVKISPESGDIEIDVEDTKSLINSVVPDQDVSDYILDLYNKVSIQ